MANSPLFSATITTGHPCRTYIGAPSEYFLHSDTTNKPAFLSLPLPTSTMCYLPQHNQCPTTLHTCSMFQANHIVHAPVLEVMGLGHHKDLRGFESASFSTLRSTSLFIICSFYYHMLSKLTSYMFMFLLCISTPVCCMYFHCWHWVVFPPEKPISRHVLWFLKGFSHGNTKGVSERKLWETHYVFLSCFP